ncbi:MT-A70-domain-containing protein [Microstroma glucosiphilum]|uniref:mRNA m(6)A methyltransferase n=1 Tax=Pseudomicrostroma glucosiphilum TaxID=1684307 RepID=A0A316UDG1_9BASI|nr:MT-A70-domain-containing protein [Pseudomicrostroma glucosiphilum]PWN23287.1 MT-A70-domain-containing protein [Pseudomicrostroma glucosiphilum]
MVTHDEASQATEAIYAQFLTRPTAKRKLLAKAYRPPHNTYQEFCEHLTEDDCARARSAEAGSSNTASPVKCCRRIHFEVVRYPQTEDDFGHCSYLSTCHRTATCKYLHFRPVAPIEAPDYQWKCSWPDWRAPAQGDDLAISEMAVKHPPRALLSRDLPSWVIGGNKARPSAEGGSTFPPQWINADLSTFDLTVLGKFDVIVQDTAFDIHMSLPYGTMTDSAIRSMPLQHLQDTGLIFFWVTGRAMELGRELLSHWGYTRVDELVWVKVGQTQRLIRTGRTGHWMNHTKEHCLIGAKNASGVGGPIPEWAHRGLDSDVLVSEVRDTSRKPDELYAMIERLAPGGRKLELFGRKHNARSGWLTIGNQLKSHQIYDPDLQRRIDGAITGVQGPCVRET